MYLLHHSSLSHYLGSSPTSSNPLTSPYALQNVMSYHRTCSLSSAKLLALCAGMAGVGEGQGKGGRVWSLACLGLRRLAKRRPLTRAEEARVGGRGAAEEMTLEATRGEVRLLAVALTAAGKGGGGGIDDNDVRDLVGAAKEIEGLGMEGEVDVVLAASLDRGNWEASLPALERSGFLEGGRGTMPVTMARVGCLMLLREGGGKEERGRALVSQANESGCLDRLLLCDPRLGGRSVVGVLVYAAYIGAGGWGGRPGGEDLEALAEAYSGGEGGTGDRWEHYVGGGEGDVGCFLIDGLRSRAVEEGKGVDVMVEVCGKEGVRIEDVVNAGVVVRALKDQAADRPRIMRGLARLCRDGGPRTRAVLKRWFESSDEGILLPVCDGLPELLEAIGAGRGDERWCRKAKEAYQAMRGRARRSCLPLVPLLSRESVALASDLFGTCADVLVTLSTTPGNYDDLAACLEGLRVCLDAMDGPAALEAVGRCMRSHKVVNSLSSSLTFPVTTAMAGLERVRRSGGKAGWGKWSYMSELGPEDGGGGEGAVTPQGAAAVGPRTGVDLHLGALGSSDPDVAAGALRVVNAAMGLWTAMSAIADTARLAANPPSNNGELEVSYDADAVAEARGRGQGSSWGAEGEKPRGSTLGLIVNYILGSEVVEGAWDVIRGVMRAGGVSVADLVDVKVLVSGVKGSLGEGGAGPGAADAVAFLKEAVEGNHDVAALILSDPKISSALLWSASTPRSVASTCAGVIATVWESPPHSALSSCVPTLKAESSLVSILISAVLDPLGPCPDVKSTEAEVEEYATECDLRSACIRAMAVELWRGDAGEEGRKSILDNFERLTESFLRYSPALLSTPPGHHLHAVVSRYAISMSWLVKSWGSVVTSFLGKAVADGAPAVNTSPGGRKRTSSGEGTTSGKIDSRGMAVKIVDMLAHSSSTSSGFEVGMEIVDSMGSPASGGLGGAKLSSSTLALLPPPPPSTYNGALVAVEASELLCSFVAHSSAPATILGSLETACRLLFRDTELTRGARPGSGSDAGERAAYEISQRLRLRLLTVGLATVTARSSGPWDDKDDGVRGRMVSVCCNVLASSAVSGFSWSGEMIDSEDKKFDGGVGEGSSEATKLFEVTVALLTSLLPGEEGPYAREYVQALHRGGGVENMLRWLRGGDRAFDAVGRVGGAKTLSAVAAVVRFLHTASASSIDVARHLHFTCGVSRALCNGLGGYVGDSTAESRGYVVVLKNRADEAGSGLGGELNYKKSFLEDPAFAVWIKVIKSVSAGVSVCGDDAAAGAVNFLCQHSEVFLRCLALTPSVGGGKYTVQGLEEVGAICELVSVLASRAEAWRRVKEVGGAEKLISSIMLLTRDLCCFLGSSVIAREILGGRGQTPTSRHEAISFAHSASSSILAVTAEDQTMAGGGGSIDSVFHKRIERLAGSALLHCVSAVTRAHPANSCLVRFTPEESAALNLNSCVSVGSMVGVRFGGGLEGGGEERFGEVLALGRDGSLSVRFGGPGGSVERGIQAFRVSGIEDSILRKPVLSLEGGGSTVEEINRAKVGVSHLGLAVKWCKGFWLSQRGGGARDQREDVPEIAALCERLIILMALELELGIEKGLVVGSDEKLCFMILSLFGTASGRGQGERGGGRGGRGGRGRGDGGASFGAGILGLVDRETISIVHRVLGDFYVAGLRAMDKGGVGVGGGMRGRSFSSIGGVWDLLR